MAEPSFFPEATTPRIKDTQRRTWVKILGIYQNAGGALVANNPRIKDSLKRLKVKVNKAQQGVT